MGYLGLEQDHPAMTIAIYIAVLMLATWAVCRLLGIQMPWD
jgi:hypothetical protein